MTADRVNYMTAAATSRSMLLSGRLSVISDQSATLQMSKVTGDTRCGHTSGVDHPRARAYVHVGVVHAMHLGGPLPFMAAAATKQLH